MTPERTARLRRRLLWLISTRVAIVTVLLGAGILAEIRTQATWPTDPFFFLLGLTYALTAVYTVTLRFAVRRRWLVDLQFALDTGLISALVIMTGGVTSFFSSLYALPIVAANAVQDRRAGVLVAFLSSVLYAGIILAQYNGTLGVLMSSWVPMAVLPSVGVALYTLGLGVLGFVGVATLSGYLAERVRRADARFQQASSQIADLQAFHQYVVESLASGLTTTDSAGRVLTFNPSAERITGRATADVIGRPIGEVLPLPSVVQERLRFGPSREEELEVPYGHPSGQQVEISVRVAPLLTPNGHGGSLLMFDDVTQARRAEREGQMQQRLAAVGEMAAGIAHEIRNPLASMSGSIQILSQDLPLDDEQKRLMDIVLRESTRLNETIRTFLDYAKPRKFQTKRLDLRQVIEDTALLIRHGSEFGTHHRLEVAVPTEPVWFDADENQVRQIVWNLATNALHAMPDGGRLRVSSRAIGDSAVLTVSDNGVGIPKADLGDVFQPFAGTFGQGTGLGLAIVHRIVTDYGGTIRVQSEAGQGTTVEVVLPRTRHVAAAPPQRVTM